MSGKLSSRLYPQTINMCWQGGNQPFLSPRHNWKRWNLPLPFSGHSSLSLIFARIHSSHSVALIDSFRKKTEPIRKRPLDTSLEGKSGKNVQARDATKQWPLLSIPLFVSHMSWWRVGGEMATMWEHKTTLVAVLNLRSKIAHEALLGYLPAWSSECGGSQVEIVENLRSPLVNFFGGAPGQLAGLSPSVTWNLAISIPFTSLIKPSFLPYFCP